MNNTNQPADRVFLTTEVERLSAALGQAHADVALLRRLKDAEKDATRIADELSAAQDRLALANADAIIKLREAEFGNLRRIAVTVIPPAGCALTAISARYTICYERLVYDGNARQNVWREQSVNGFAALAPDAYSYLMLANPTAIPAIILALAPNDAAAAMDAYFLAMRRGHMTTAIAA